MTANNDDTDTVCSAFDSITDYMVKERTCRNLVVIVKDHNGRPFHPSEELPEIASCKGGK